MLCLIVLSCIDAPAAEAASLRIAPVSLDLIAPTSAAIIRLRNEEARSIHVQIRPFAWGQNETGQDILEPTRDLVASPPIMEVLPNVDYVVRIIRLSKRPVVGEESYRLLIDELPDARRRANGTVAVLLRYSIPIFVSAPEAEAQSVAWRLDHSSSGDFLTATNSGHRHLRVSNMRLQLDTGAQIPLSPGLAGYVLGGSSKRWLVPRRIPPTPANAMRVMATSEAGVFDAAVEVGISR